jgi:tetratricopeptide (TPR) repeat protein
VGTLLTFAGDRAVGDGGRWAAAAQALDAGGDLREARDRFEAAYHAAERSGDPRAMAEAALGTAGWWLGEQRTAVGAELLRSRLRHALTRLSPGSSLAVRVRARLAAEDCYRTGETEAVLAALDASRYLADPAVRAEVLSMAHHCLLGPDHATVRRALADELVGEAARGGRRGQLLMGLLCQTVDLFLDGDEHAHRRLTELRAELSGGEHLAAGYVVAAIEVMLQIRAGRLAEAEQAAHECHRLGVQAGDGDADAWLGAHLAAIYWYSGRVRELLPAVGALADNPELSNVDYSFRGAVAVASAAAGDHRTATAAIAGLLGGELPRSGVWLVTMSSVVEAAALLGDTAAAATAYERLLPYRNQLITASLAVACFGSVEHVLGVASLVTGDLDRAIGHLERAVRRNLALGHWPALSLSRSRLAEALGRRRGPGDLGTAAAIREQAGPPAGAAAHGGNGPASLSRTGRRWRLERGGRAVSLRQSVGVLHLAVLLANPDTEIAALDLVAGLAAIEAPAGRSTSRQPVLDRTAVRQFRQRLAEAADDSPERTWLAAELAANTRSAGPSRTFSDDTERARLAVGRAIRRTIALVTQADEALGAHLDATVHTGGRCWYRP